MTTLYTAKKYAVPALEAHCVEFLKKNLRADNAFMLLTQVREPGWGPGGGWVGISQLLTPCRVPLAPPPLGGSPSFSRWPWQLLAGRAPTSICLQLSRCLCPLFRG